MSDNTLNAYGTFLLRVSLGLMAFAYGFILKVMTFTPGGTADYFVSVGYPAALAYLVIFAEAVGGIALILGLWTRWVSLALVPILIGATLEHTANGWVFSVEGGGWSYPAFWTVALIVQAMLGDGAFAIGSLMGRRKQEPKLA